MKEQTIKRSQNGGFQQFSVVFSTFWVYGPKDMDTFDTDSLIRIKWLYISGHTYDAFIYFVQSIDYLRHKQNSKGIHVFVCLTVLGNGQYAKQFFKFLL